MRIQIRHFASKVSLEHLGLGFLVAWVYCSWFGPSLFVGNGLATSNDLSWLVSIGACVASILGLSLALGSRLLSCVRLALPLAALGTAFGTILSSATAFKGLPMPLQTACGVLTGVSSGALYVMLSERMSTYSDNLVRLVAVLTALVTLACYVASCLLPRPFAVAFVAALPLMCAACLAAGEGQMRGRPGAARTEADEKSQTVIRHLFVVSGATSAVASFCWATAVPGVTVLNASAAISLGALLGIAMTLLVAVRTLFLRATPNIAQLYGLLIPTLIASILLLVQGSPTAVCLGAVLCIALSMGADFFLLLYFGSFLKERFSNPCRAMCLCEAATNLGIGTGNLAGIWVLGLAGQQAGPLHDVYLALVLASSLMLAYIDRQQGTIARMSSSGARRGAVDDIARRYGLTARERDTFELLAQGRSLPFISDALYINRSTVETHRKHIYAKLQIHNRQELIDLVEDSL